MNYSIIFGGVILLLLVLYYGQIYLGRFQLVGEQNPLKKEADGLWQIYYFHSPHCGACKSITPIIAEEYEPVNIIDISTDLELARKFNIRATPTVIFVENNIISNVHLGSDAIPHIKEFINSK